MSIEELIEKLTDMANDHYINTDNDLYLSISGASYVIKDVVFNEDVECIEITGA